MLFAITAASMLAVVGLLYSFGAVLSQRRALQAAADAACLAGTWQVVNELSSDNRSDANILATIQQYATANGVQANAVSGTYVDASGLPVGSVGAGGQFPVTARGVRVAVSSSVPSVLPGFVNVFSVLVQDSATATAQPTQPPTSAPVIPIAISANSYVAHATYDLFKNPPSGSGWATLDLGSSGAPTFGATSTNEQYWSDGQHLGSWTLSQPRTVNLADAAYYDSLAAGLQDNVRRQALTDSQGHAYALVTLPVYDTSTSTTIHVVGFAAMKLVGSTLTSTSAPGLLVPYAAAAFGTPQAPSPDVGATLVGLIS